MLEQKKPPFPNLWQAIYLLVFLIFILQFNYLAALWAGFDLRTVQVSPLITAVSNLLGFGLLIRWGYLRAEAPFTAIFPLRRVSIGVLGGVATVVVGMQIMLSELDNIGKALFPALRPSGPLDFLKGGAGEIMLLIIIVAPLTEEFFFRGLLVYGFTGNYGSTKAIWFSACLFGLMHLGLPPHFDPLRVIFATALGFLLAWLLLKTNSLWPCLFGHAFVNALPLLTSLVSLQIPGFTSAGYGKIIGQPLWFDLLGLVLAGGGLFFLKKLYPARQ